MPLLGLYSPETIFRFNIPAIARHPSVIGDCIRSFSATPGLATSRATCSQARIVKAFQYFSWGKAHLQCHKIQHQLLGHERSIELIVSFVTLCIFVDGRSCSIQMIVRWRNGHKNQRQSEKISSWQSPWLHRDLQILWIKSLPFQIRTSLWSNKAVLTTHFLTSPLMFCSNLVVGPIHRDLSSQAQTLLVHVKLVPWHFIKKNNGSSSPLIRRKTFNVFVSFEMIPIPF